MSSDEQRAFPPPFDARRPDGTSLRIVDVDALIALAAEHAGVPTRRLDRRKLEAGLVLVDPPPMHAERARMVFVGRARQRRIRALRAGIRRTRAIVVLVLLVLATLVYGVRLEHKLGQKLRVARARGAALAEAREAARRLDARRAEGGLSLDARDALTAEFEQAEDRVSQVKRRYDDAANDYDSAVRGFPTEPFVRLVGLPPRLPMSWQPGAPGAQARNGAGR